MTAGAIVIALFVLGCAAIPVGIIVGPKLLRPPQSIPWFDTRMRDCPYPPEDVAKLMMSFRNHWKRMKLPHGDSIDEAFDRLSIYWIKGDSFMVGDLKVAGVTDRPDQIRVACGSAYPTVRHTALAHELVHLVLWNATGEPDPDHTHDEYKGWTKEHNELVKAVRGDLKLLEN